MAKIYAVKQGQDPKTKAVVRNCIFLTWAEAEPFIKGVAGAKYKSFANKDEANAYFYGTSNAETITTKAKPSNSSAKTKFYAIKSGQHPTTKMSVGGIILTSWAEAQPYVSGVKGAEYKSFPNEDAANAYLQGDASSVVTSLEMQPGVLYCYVDGSFNSEIPNYSFGLCCVLDGKVVHIDNGQGNNKDAIEMQQIGGELLGAIKSLTYAKQENHHKVAILHDYMGVAKHAIPVDLGGWKRSNPFSDVYFTWMQTFFTSNSVIKVNFLKVDAHTGNDFNEIADGLAKLAVGIKPEPIFRHMVEKHQVDLSKVGA